MFERFLSAIRHHSTTKTNYFITEGIQIHWLLTCHHSYSSQIIKLASLNLVICKKTSLHLLRKII